MRFLRTTFDIVIVAYIDDLLIQAKDEQTCRIHANITILVLQDLGYGINFRKLALPSTKVVIPLGFIWNSEDMTITLPPDKSKKITARTQQLAALDIVTFLPNILQQYLRVFIVRVETSLQINSHFSAREPLFVLVLTN